MSKRFSQIKRECVTCKKDYWIYNYRRNISKFCSSKCKRHRLESKLLISKNNKAKTQKESPSWKGDQAGYFAIHIWLKKYYGKAYMCSANYCSGKSQTYQWALIKGKKYTHDIENFIQLCRSCHSKYDYSEKQREFRRNFLKIHKIASKNYGNKQQIAQAKNH